MANLFPENTEQSWGADQLSEVQDEGVRFGRSWRFDFDAGEFVMTPTRKIAGAEGTEAWILWCQKAIRTPRYRHLIYSRDYGQEFEELIGRGYSRAVQESEIQRIARETLLIDPRTASVEGFVFEWQGERCSFTCRVANIHDEELTLEGSVS
ncbi:uncharacterized protein DUF2634 [Fontibacillus phaseoli]|uniref:Uncharacterized protein DUF2634 n=1 Tax=Fontibacillus phaseoli TaxID=1416533 RepID=A0A369BM35_9BACL|nr:DUF2634 domain-containing protein [Fontibacillus phaseoli]RCX22613.1 uncharacterized protein DUF2634 [Fontibacillus phaseoli]